MTLVSFDSCQRYRLTKIYDFYTCHDWYLSLQSNVMADAIWLCALVKKPLCKTSKLIYQHPGVTPVCWGVVALFSIGSNWAFRQATIPIHRCEMSWLLKVLAGILLPTFSAMRRRTIDIARFPHRVLNVDIWLTPFCRVDTCCYKSLI